MVSQSAALCFHRNISNFFAEVSGILLKLRIKILNPTVKSQLYADETHSA